MHRLVIPPRIEGRVLQTTHIAALLTRIPNYRMLPTTIKWEKHEFSDRHVFSTMVPPTTAGVPYEVILFEPEENPHISECVQHLLYARSFLFSMARILTHYAWNRDPEYGFPGIGFFSENEPIVSGQQYLEQFVEILSNGSPLTFQAARYRQKYGHGNGESVLKEASEAITTYLCGFGFQVRHEEPTNPFKNHQLLYRLVADFLEAHNVVSSKHD